MPLCTDEVWAACNVGSCLTLLCFEHFDGTLSNVHKLSCKGRGRPEELVPINPPCTTLSKPATTTTITTQANIQQQPLIDLQTNSSITSFDVPVILNGDEQLIISSTHATSTSAATTISSHGFDLTDQMLVSPSSNQVNMFATVSSCHPDVKCIRKQSIVGKNGTRVLSFQNGWFEEFPWLHYCMKYKEFCASTAPKLRLASY